MLRKILMVLATVNCVCATPLASSQSDNASDPDVCVSRGCIEVASYLPQSMNTSADPCNDFYNFACGNWAKSHLFGNGHHMINELKYTKQIELIKDLIDESKSINTVAFKKMHHYLEVCKGYVKNETRVEEETQPIFEELPPLSLLGDKFDESKFSFTDLEAKLFSKAGANSAILASTFSFTKNSSEMGIIVPFVIALSPPYAPVLRDRKTNAEKFESVKRDMKSIIELLHLYLKKDISKINITEKVDEIIDYQTQIAELELKHIGTDIETTLVSEEELKQILPMFDVRSFLSTVAPEANYDFSLGILLKNKPFIVDVGNLAKRSMSAFANVVAISFAIWFINMYTPVACDDKINYQFAPLIDHLFVKRFMTKQDIEVGQELIANVRTALEEVFAEADWLDEITRNNAIKKAKAAHVIFGPHPRLMNHTALDKQFEKLDILNEKEWISLLKKANEYNLKYKFHQLGTLVGQDYYATTEAEKTTEYNAIYSPTSNLIMFHSGFTQAPLYRGYYPAQFSYGALGFAGGHESTHAFDSQGKNYGPYGTKENWWTPEAETAFLNRSQCFIDSFNNFTDQLSGMNENGELTLSENIADAGGVAVVYKAFQNYKKKHKQPLPLPGLTQYSDEQIFFLSSVQFLCNKETPEMNKATILEDIHALSKFRARSLATNTKEFAEAFKCPKGSLHNPEKRCKIW